MKFLKLFSILLIAISFSSNIWAGAYKCTDENGKTSYQSSPCAAENSAIKINMKTGGSTDLSIAKRKNELEKEKQHQLEAEQLIKQQHAAERKKQTLIEHKLNQQLIKDNPRQFSAFAIPPYNPDKLSYLVKQFEVRLPEIEKFRRLAAQKSLASEECIRVESDQLSNQSTLEQLVIAIDCSSGKTFLLNETQLLK